MKEKEMEGREDREAIVYIVAAIPFLLWRSAIAYLRMRSRAKKEGRRFYAALLRDGVPHEHARELTYLYSSSISLTQMIREMGPFTS